MMRQMVRWLQLGGEDYLRQCIASLGVKDEDVALVLAAGQEIIAYGLISQYAKASAFDIAK